MSDPYRALTAAEIQSRKTQLEAQAHGYAQSGLPMNSDDTAEYEALVAELRRRDRAVDDRRSQRHRRIPD